jgi:hypothetical protein
VTGYYTSRLRPVTPLISAYRPIQLLAGSGCGGTVQFSFTDGIPDPSETAADCSVSSSTTAGSGFEFTVAADTTPRTLRVYLGIANAQGKLVAFLSDGSAPVIVDESLEFFGAASMSVVYTIDFSAASAGQTLTVRWLMDQPFNPRFRYFMAYGSAGLYAATLSGPPAQASMEIAGIDPASGPIGTLVTITGVGFGATQGTGSVAIGNTLMNVVSWSDTTIVATVASGTTTDILSVQQGSQTAYGATFTVYTVGGGGTAPYQVSPSSLNMLVGQSRTVSVTDNGQPVTHLGWATTDPTIVSLSSDDPPLITAMAPGSAAVYAGIVPIPVTVYAGTSLPPGTPIWSLSIGVSGGPSTTTPTIVPAIPFVPSSDASGSSVQPPIPDVFASYPGSLSAITSEGATSWTISGLPTGTKVIPGFSGYVFLNEPITGINGNGQIAVVQRLIQVVDPNTHQLRTLYTASDPTSEALVAIPHPSGPVFVQDKATIYTIDPATGNQLGMATPSESVVTTYNGSTSSSPVSAALAKMVVAGDGNAYIPYQYGTTVSTSTQDFPDQCDIRTTGTYTTDQHLALLRVAPDGTTAEIPVREWKATGTGVRDDSCAAPFPWTIQSTNSGDDPSFDVSLITNSDSGVAVFITNTSTVCQSEFSSGTAGQTTQIQNSGCPDRTTLNVQLNYVSNDSVTAQINGAVPLPTESGGAPAGVEFGFTPLLQRADGSYIGVDATATDKFSDTSVAGTKIVTVGPSGGVVWAQAITTPASSLTPLYATAAPQCVDQTSEACTNLRLQSPDGGVIVTTSQPGSLGTLYSLDQNGSITTQTPDIGAVRSWTGGWYMPMVGAGQVLSAVNWYDFDYAGTNAATKGGDPAQLDIYLPNTTQVMRDSIASRANRYVGSTRWQDWVDWKGDVHYGCNIFVQDVLFEAGTMPPVSDEVKGWKQWLKYKLGIVETNFYPAFAGDWANLAKNLLCWPPLLPGGANAARPGDVIAQQIGFSDATGHVGIVVGPEQTASADSTASPPGLITRSNFGFRPDSYPGYGQKSKAVVRRYTCY